ncbi:MAG: tRNA (N6-isopentenyl adenosine(37)-C2)-methylthiotransferase MiaB [Clostridiales bacterium]|nr:tRNA (N6-isopentenyl adenosine(37)-C2)-methylthiotransferase MiaB [Clostridiales bacterium]
MENAIEKIREYVSARQDILARPLYAAVKTFGCQMNAHDSEKLEAMLIQMGYNLISDEREADLALINTCCVRENAENKLYGYLGLLKGVKTRNPEMKIAVCGCMTQRNTAADTIIRNCKHVNIVFGTFNLHRFPELLLSAFESDTPIVDIWKEPDETDLAATEHRHFAKKASVNVMYGCDNFCSYCIVPYVRGRERSRPVNDILEEIKLLSACGAVEIMLLGQNVNSYGRSGRYTGGGPVSDNQTDFAGLLNRICEIDGIERIRFMTSHPRDLSDDLIETIRIQPKVCKHVHLPVQSGSSRVLNLMNRRYNRESYLELAERLKERIPGAALTTDIIVGFPGETEADFEDTLDLAERVRYAGVFTFIYSRRSGTPAAAMGEQPDAAVAARRFNRLLSIVNPIIYEENQKHIGKVLTVLAEKVSASDRSLLTGRADNNALVHFAADPACSGQFVRVKITGCKTFYLTGEKV